MSKKDRVLFGVFDPHKITPEKTDAGQSHVPMPSPYSGPRLVPKPGNEPESESGIEPLVNDLALAGVPGGDSSASEVSRFGRAPAGGSGHTVNLRVEAVGLAFVLGALALVGAYFVGRGSRPGSSLVPVPPVVNAEREARLLSSPVTRAAPPAATARSTPPPGTPPPALETYAVKVMAYRPEQRPIAERLVQKLTEAGFTPARVVKDQSGLHVVLVGSFTTKDAAEACREQVDRQKIVRRANGIVKIKDEW